LLLLKFVNCVCFPATVMGLNEKLAETSKVKTELQLQLDGIQSSVASVQVRTELTETVELTLQCSPITTRGRLQDITLAFTYGKCLGLQQRLDKINTNRLLE